MYEYEMIRTVSFYVRLCATLCDMQRSLTHNRTIPWRWHACGGYSAIRMRGLQECRPRTSAEPEHGRGCRA